MTGGGTHWVFGYGSLMWNPGFPHIGAQPARISGFHRKLCVYSFHYRGTPEKPGLVFGLDRGGSCTGMAFEVACTGLADCMGLPAPARAGDHGVPGGFLPCEAALTYVVDRQHDQCAAGLTDQQIAALVLGAQ
jgi:cation transport protein ChaC